MVVYVSMCLTPNNLQHFRKITKRCCACANEELNLFDMKSRAHLSMWYLDPQSKLDVQDSLCHFPLIYEHTYEPELSNSTRMGNLYFKCSHFCTKTKFFAFKFRFYKCHSFRFKCKTCRKRLQLFNRSFDHILPLFCCRWNKSHKISRSNRHSLAVVIKCSVCYMIKIQKFAFFSQTI